MCVIHAYIIFYRIERHFSGVKKKKREVHYEVYGDPQYLNKTSDSESECSPNIRMSPVACLVLAASKSMNGKMYILEMYAVHQL